MKKVSILLFALPILSFSQIDEDQMTENRSSKIELGPSSKEFLSKRDKDINLNNMKKSFKTQKLLII